MSSSGTRERTRRIFIDVPKITEKADGFSGVVSTDVGGEKQITVSESHRRNPKTGHYDAGGPFYTSRVTDFSKFGHLNRSYSFTANRWYTGPVGGRRPTSTEMAAIGYKNTSKSYGDKMESSMISDGTTAISLCNPINSASDLGVSLAEAHREGLPSIPGVPTWKERTRILRGAGSEFLNAEFGWLSLVSEIGDVVKAARTSRDIMNQYHHGEGRNTHRRFDFPLDRYYQEMDVGVVIPRFVGPPTSFESGIPDRITPTAKVSLLRETKRWFEGCFTYALPSSTNSWRKALGFGSNADQLFGLALSPDILWELTPWSWAVDWFSNAGEVVNNVTNFGLAGLVMRYGYMMTETVERVSLDIGPYPWLGKSDSGKAINRYSDPCSAGYESVTKRRVPASPFGFSVGWEGLSPTQLAITAALGITRLL